MLLEGPEQVYLALEVSNRLKPLFANDGSAINAFDITDVFADLSVFEGEMLTFDLDATSLAGFQLTLAATGPSAGFDFTQDIASIKITQDSGAETTETSLPANVQIAPSTRVITLTVEAREDIDVETGEKFTLSATPAGGSAVTTEITLRDPIVEVGLSVGMASIDEGDPANIDITLSRPLTQFLKDQASTYRANVVTKQVGNDEVLASYDILGNVAVGTDSGMFTTNYPQNSYWNGDRTYTVELDSNIPLVVAASGPVATYTVEDNEKPSVTLERVSGSGLVMEGGEVKLRARLTNAPPSGAPQKSGNQPGGRCR